MALQAPHQHLAQVPLSGRRTRPREDYDEAARQELEVSLDQFTDWG